jgi:predicted nucleotidyltransferase
MSLNEILIVLRHYKQSHQKEYGIKALGVFGSVSKGRFDEHSDLDIFVEMEKPDMFLLADIKQDIEQSLHMSVDIVRLRDKMNPLLRRRISQDGVYV